MEDVHIPGQTESEFADPAPTPEPPTPPAPAAGDTPPAEAQPGDAPAPEAPKPKEGENPAPTPEPPLPKKRSIYDDLKDTRKEKNAFRDVAVAALEAQGVTLTGNETAEELQTLAKKTPSPTPTPPAPPAEPASKLDAFAQEQGIDPATMKRLAEIISENIPKSELSAEERQQLAELKTWQQGKLQEEARAAEDREIHAQSASVKTELQIHDDAELKAVMDEIVKLAHSERFHDKEVGYIVWANKDALAKLVSPKKPSFENGGQAGESDATAEVEFSGKMTPAAAQKAVESSYPKAGIEIRRGS